MGQLLENEKLLAKENDDVITFRIVEALTEATGKARYWVFAVGNGTCHLIISNANRRRALSEVFDRVSEEDIVESIKTTGLLREEFGSEFRSRLAPYLIPHE